MELVVINLPRAVERRLAVRKQLKKMALSAEFFAACDGMSPRPDWFRHYREEQFVLQTGRTMSCDELACFASHRNLWQRCVDRNMPLLILEDDCKLDEEFPQALKAATALIDDYGFLRLQHEERADYLPVGSFQNFSLEIYTRVPKCSMAYAIGPNTARGLLAASVDIAAPVDIFLRHNWLHHQAIFALRPYVVRQNPSVATSQIRRPARLRRKTLKLSLQRLRFRWQSRLRSELFARRWIRLHQQADKLLAGHSEHY